MLDIMGVDISAQLTTSHQLRVTIDDDADLTNGVFGNANIAELAPGTIPINNIDITSVTSSTIYTKTAMTLTAGLKVPSSLFSSNTKLCVILPS